MKKKLIFSVSRWLNGLMQMEELFESYLDAALYMERMRHKEKVSGNVELESSHPKSVLMYRKAQGQVYRTISYEQSRTLVASADKGPFQNAEVTMHVDILLQSKELYTHEEAVQTWEDGPDAKIWNLTTQRWEANAPNEMDGHVRLHLRSIAKDVDRRVLHEGDVVRAFRENRRFLLARRGEDFMACCLDVEEEVDVSDVELCDAYGEPQLILEYNVFE